MTVGDVNAVALMIGSTGVTLWTATVATAVLFEDQVQRAAAMAEGETRKSFGAGALLLFGAGIFALILVNQPNGLLKLVGWVLLIGLLALGIFGSAGLTTLAAFRIRRMEENPSRFKTLAQAGGLLIAAGFLPVVGWFFLFPVMLMMSLGSGWRSLVGKKKATPVLAESPVAQMTGNGP